MASKQDVVAALEKIRDQIVAVAEAVPEASWAANVYENGWNERELLYHIASMTGPASFILMMSRLPANAAAGSGNYDLDAFNRDQVKLREGRSVGEALDEVRANIQRSIQDVEKATDDELQKHYVAPWGTDGTVAEVIIASVKEHLGMHLADLRAGAVA